MVNNSQIEDLDKENKKIEEEIDKQIEENLQIKEDKVETSAGDSQQTDTTTSENQSNTDENSENQPNTDENQGRDEPQPQNQEQDRVPDGVSRAYKDIPNDDFDTKAPQNKKEEKEEKSTIVPPKRDRGGTKGKSGGDNIMEVFWNDCIMAFYAWSIDTVVDNTLDFAEWVLFSPYKSGGKEEKEEKSKKNIYMIGEEFYKERADRFSKEKAKLVEINENLDKEKNGISPTWVLWGKEPDFYQKLRKIHEKALADPTSREAEFMQKYGLGVDKEVVDGRFAKEEKIFTITTRLATLEEVTRGKNNTISPEFLNKINDLEHKLKEKNVNLDQFKADLADHILDIQQEVDGENSTCTEIKQKLEEINKIVDKGKKISDITKAVSGKVKEIKDVSQSAVDNEDVIKEHIQKRSQEHYNNIMANIDKIHEAYKEHPEEMKENIKQYLSSINSGVKEAKMETDKIINQSIDVRSKNKKAKDTISKVHGVINDFEIKGKKISERPTAAQKDEFTLTEKQFSEAIKEYRLER